MSRVASVVNDPSSVLNELFESYKGEVFPTRVARYFADLFDAQENFSQVNTNHWWRARDVHFVTR